MSKKGGVNSSCEVNPYGRIEWSTEPELITLDINVHITDGVRFFTPDVGTLFY